MKQLTIKSVSDANYTDNYGNKWYNIEFTDGQSGLIAAKNMPKPGETNYYSSQQRQGKNGPWTKFKKEGNPDQQQVKKKGYNEPLIAYQVALKCACEVVQDASNVSYILKVADTMYDHMVKKFGLESPKTETKAEPEKTEQAPPPTEAPNQVPDQPTDKLPF